jgi:hypothetical protein
MNIFIYPHINPWELKWTCPRNELIITEGLSKIQDVQLVQSENEADFIIWHHVPQLNNQKSFELINKIDSNKLIIIDCIDENDQWFLPELDPERYFLYFKRSLVKLDNQGTRSLIPTAERQYAWDYAILDGFLQPEVEKTIDVGCYLRPSCYFRSLVLQNMSHWFNQNQNKFLTYIGPVSDGSRSMGKHVYFDKTYFSYVAKTKIIVSSGPYGWCGDSRGGEAIANKCLYMSNEFFDLMPEPPLTGKHWVKFNPLDSDELYNELQFILTYPRLIKEIASEGYEHCMKYHSSKARMEYVLQKIEEHS